MTGNSKLLGLISACMLAVTSCAPEGEVNEISETDDLGSTSQKIVGGSSTTIENFPWQVSLQTSTGSHFCGGSIIASDWILTAQHCVDGQNASRLRVVAGMTARNQASSGQVRNVASIVHYPGFSNSTLRNDLALLKLVTPIDLSTPKARAIPLVTSSDASAGLTAPGVAATVSGWGTLTEGSGSLPNTLQQVEVPIVSLSEARAAYNGTTLFDDQIPAGGNAGDSCQGDSGGPLIVKASDGTAKLAGIVSWGFGCGQQGVPGIYTRVSSFDSWISTTANLSTDVTPPPNGGGGSVTPPPSFSGVELFQPNLSDSRGRTKSYSVTVPAGVTKFTVSISGGMGDADLYVRQGSAPTASTYDCRPFKTGNVETCTFNAPTAGTWNIAVNAYRTYQGVTLSADYQ